MVALDAAQERNLRAALAVTDDPAKKVRLAFAAWTESRARNYANDGRNTSRSPGFDKHPEWPGILRRSLDLPHDAVGSNGRSTGIFQQTSADVNGGWGDMAGTMDPATSARRFLNALRVTNNPVYSGTLLTPTGSRKVDVLLSDPIAADVLRVQQPLADEAESSNYNASQVAVAKAIVAQLTTDTKDGFDVASLDDLTKIVKDNAGTPIADTAKAVQSVGADVDKLTEWTQGGYDGSSKEQTNLAGIWRRADNVQQMLVGGYQGSTTTAKNNVDAIYWMLLNLCTALIPNVKHPDRAPNDQADPAPAADVQS